jgi:hypothetical protein
MSDTIEALDAWCPPDLHARAVGPHPVGVVHDGGGEPQHTPLHLVEHGEVELGLRAGGRGHTRNPKEGQSLFI